MDRHRERAVRGAGLSARRQGVIRERPFHLPLHGLSTRRRGLRLLKLRCGSREGAPETARESDGFIRL